VQPAAASAAPLVSRSAALQEQLLLEQLLQAQLLQDPALPISSHALAMLRTASSQEDAARFLMQAQQARLQVPQAKQQPHGPQQPGLLSPQQQRQRPPSAPGSKSAPLPAPLAGQLTAAAPSGHGSSLLGKARATLSSGKQTLLAKLGRAPAVPLARPQARQGQQGQQGQQEQQEEDVDLFSIRLSKLRVSTGR
jgi:hypothetical protein